MKISPIFASTVCLITALLTSAAWAQAVVPNVSADSVPQGLETSDWASIRAAHESWQHAVQPIADTPGRWQARNPGQQWTTVFDGRGFTTRAKGADWEWGLELRSYGFPGRAVPAQGQPLASAEGQHMAYQWDGNLREWWINDQRGLEHGFTLRQQPLGASGAAMLEMELGVRGTLRARVAPDGQAVHFRDARGAPVVTYAGLKVWDATGRELPATFAQGTGGGLILRVDERGAFYPLTIDPIAQQAYLKASQVSNGDEFGCSVAVSGNTVVVGARYESSSTTGVNSTPDENLTYAGAAYVFVRSGTTWTQQAYLKAGQVSNGDEFGSSVAVNGDTIVVGARQESSSTTGVNSTPNESAFWSGAAYVFVRSSTTWTQQAYLKASQVSAQDRFGTSVAVSGDTVIVGAPDEDSSTTGVNSTPNESTGGAGAAYVFVRSGTTWAQQAYLKASQVSNGDGFGGSVGVSGDTVVVGAQYEASGTTGVNSTPDETASGSGAAYVFVRSGTDWSQQAYLKASQVSSIDRFGSSVAVSGNTIVVGAQGEDSGTTGVNSTPDETVGGAGAAYVFVRGGTAWSQQAYLKASQVSTFDGFGSSVALSGSTIVVGATGEDSGTTGVDSTPDETAAEAGAAYVFVRSGTDWSQQAYLKASQVSTEDLFGWSVAVSGDTVIVGAPYEDSSTTGVNSSADETALNAGAAYIFTGVGSASGITLTGLGTEISTGDTSPSALDGTDFGTSAVLSAQTVRRFTIGNSGGAALNLTGTPRVAVSGPNAADFTVTALPPATVDAGGTGTFDLTFDPRLPGLRTATVTIATDDPGIPSFTFDVSGFGSLPTQLAQTIAFNPPSVVYLSQSPLTLDAKASSGLPVTLSLGSGPASLAGNVLTLTAPGTVKVTATQPGGSNYLPARAVLRTIVVRADPTAMTLTNLNQTYDGQPKPISVLGASAATITYRISGVEGTTPPTNAGSYPVKAVAGTLVRTGTLVIAKAPLTVTPHDVRKFAGQANPPLTRSITGFLGSDTEAVLTRAPVLATRATAASPGGAYPITASGAVAANYSFVYRQGTLVVESFAGSYEALLTDTTPLPVAKLALRITDTAKGIVFSATLNPSTESGAVALKGVLTTDSGNERATGIAASTTAAGTVYVINFTLPLIGDMTAEASRNLVPLGSAAKVQKLPVLRNVAYAGAHTAILQPATPAGTSVPPGAGWATATIAPNGTMALAGRLADATRFTTTLSPDGAADPGYRLFIQPYLPARTGTYVAGEFSLAPHPDLVNRRSLESAPLTWVKDDRALDPSYRAGFGPVTTALGIDPWLPPVAATRTTTAITLAQRLGLTGPANPFEVQHTPTGSTSNANLPTALSLGARDVVTVTAPVTVPPNSTKWRTTFVGRNGTFTGSFELLDSGRKRTVSFSGVLRQAPSTSTDDVIGDGHYLLPALPGAPSNESVSGEVLFQTPAPAP